MVAIVGGDVTTSVVVVSICSVGGSDVAWRQVVSVLSVGGGNVATGMVSVLSPPVLVAILCSL